MVHRGWPGRVRGPVATADDDGPGHPAELKRGRIPFHRTIRETVEAALPGTCICFFGDMAGELDGVAFKALNVQASTGEAL